MMDYTITSQYPDLDEETMSCMEGMEEGKTVNQLRQMSQYFSNCCSKLEDKLHGNVTMEDFEKLKKGEPDMDMDAEQEGEE